MTLGVGGEVPIDLAAMISEMQDRSMLEAAHFGASPSYEVVRTIDPSDGANYSGGSSYAEGLPLLPSNAGLAGYRGDVRDGRVGAMSYGEAMNYAPASLTQRINALKAGAGRQFEGLEASVSLNPVWYWLAAAGVAWWVWNRAQEQRGFYR